jgi:hypothetical protein
MSNVYYLPNDSKHKTGSRKRKNPKSGLFYWLWLITIMPFAIARVLYIQSTCKHQKMSLNEFYVENGMKVSVSICSRCHKMFAET